MLLCTFFPFLKISFAVKGQGDVFRPGKYKFTGSINVQPNGNVNLRLNAKKVGAGPTLQPPSLTPTQSTHGFTTGTPSGGTGTGPTTGYTTPTEESGRMAGTRARHKHRRRASLFYLDNKRSCGNGAYHTDSISETYMRHQLVYRCATPRIQLIKIAK